MQLSLLNVPKVFQEMAENMASVQIPRGFYHGHRFQPFEQLLVTDRQYTYQRAQGNRRKRHFRAAEYPGRNGQYR
jgi:hypothetical protein